ncbi:MAG: hypothetical protein UF030_07075 [Eggerthellaceae bacterium]|nr:hypothetical protein [Eggerthellaceae bacterium]
MANAAESEEKTRFVGKRTAATHPAIKRVAGEKKTRPEATRVARSAAKRVRNL